MNNCLLYTSDAADEEDSVDLGGRRIIKKNGEFTVNIALIKNNKPCLGIVYCPVIKVLYWNDEHMIVYKKTNSKTQIIEKRKPVNENDEGLRIVVSRSHMSDKTSEYVNKLKNPKLISCGSSLKFLYIADNKADIYPRFGPTMEWDTAAAHSIPVSYTHLTLPTKRIV